jgi:hypothetical protein
MLAEAHMLGCIMLVEIEMVEMLAETVEAVQMLVDITVDVVLV